MKKTTFTLLLFLFSYSFSLQAIILPLDSMVNDKKLIFVDGKITPYDTMFNWGVKEEIKFERMEVQSRRKAIAQFGEKARVGFISYNKIEQVPAEKDASKYYLSGTVSPAYNGEYAMLFTFNPFDVSDIAHVDSTIIKKGKFYFEGVPDATNVALVTVGNYPKPTLSCEVALEKGDITIQLDSAIVKGTSLNDKYQLYRDSLNLFLNEIRNKVKGALRKYYKLRLDFITSNIHNAIGKAALYQNYSFNDEDFDIIYDLADDTLKNNPYLIQEKERIKNCHEEAKKRSMPEGKDFFDCEMNDLDGNVVQLSDYVGKSKLLLIDVWASWCGPCRAEMPQLKSIYKDYKDKGLSVLGISIDESPDRWKKALEELDLPWWQTVLPKSVQASFRDNYEVKGVPRLMLIDQNGKIIMARIELRSDSYMRAVLNSLLLEH